jgi:hypothetical protein
MRNKRKKLQKTSKIIDIIWCTLLLMTVMLIFEFMSRMGITKNHIDLNLLITRFEHIMCLFVPFLILTPFHTKYGNKLRNLKKDMLKRKQEFYQDLCIDCLLRKEYDKATFIYNKCLKNKDDRSFLTGLKLGLKYGISSSIEHDYLGKDYRNIIREKYNF